MDKIPTAEEFLLQKPFIHGMTRNDQAIVMIEFAKSHVQEALKQASEKANTIVHKHIHDENEIDGYVLIDIIDKNSILNAYSIENIK